MNLKSGESDATRISHAGENKEETLVEKLVSCNVKLVSPNYRFDPQYEKNRQNAYNGFKQLQL
jgi:hypothetical protein